MIPYIVAIIIIEGTRFIKPTTKTKRTVVCFLCALVFIALVGLRHPSMGHDLRYSDNNGYLGGFHSIANSSWSISVYKNYEIGYIFLNKLVSLFTSENQVFLLICATLSIFPFAYVIYKSDVDIQTSFIVLFGNPVFTLMYSGLRQSIAIGILFLSIIFIKRKKLLLFILFVLLAGQFHSTAYIFALAYPFYHHGSLKKNNKVYMLIIIGIAFFFRRSLLTYIGSLFSSKSRVDDNGSINMFLICLALLLALLYLYRSNNAELNGYIKIYFLACFIMVFSNVNVLAMRAALYFIDILVILIPELCEKEAQEDVIIRIKPRSGLIVLVNLMFVALGFFFIITTSWAEAYPYSFFWE